MRFERLCAIVFILSIVFLISSVSAVDLNDTDSNCSLNEDSCNLKLENNSDILSDNINSIYVDDSQGDNSNDGQSWQSSVKSFDKALDLAEDDGSIYLANGTYNGEGNTKITISKSVSIIGSGDTTFDALGNNFIFNISDDVKVTFKNIKFINAYKKSTYWENANMYGGALEINRATVVIENCSFMDNVVSYESSINKFNYGGAISNLGDLTIINSYFDSNIATSTSGIFSYGGAIYNKGKLSIKSSIFNNSKTWDFGYGGAIYNDGDMMVDDSIFANSYSLQESKGSAIYNAGNCTLLNSIIENNTISKANFYYIYGTIYNVGTLIGYGNIFRNNTGIYQAPNPEYRGSPNIYNVGNLNLTYNVFMDNAPFNGIGTDVYFNGGKVISLDDNWWGTNDNPYDSNRINVNEKIDSWILFNLSPEYTPLDIGQSVRINASWSSNSPLPLKINLLPILSVIFNTQISNNMIEESSLLNDGYAIFNFDYTQNKGSYEVTAKVGSFTQKVLVDVGKIASNISFNVTDNIIYTENMVLDVEVTTDDSNKVDGIVSVIINGNTYIINLTDSKGTISIPNLSPDTYNLKIVYEGDENYFKAFEYVNVTVKKAPTQLNISVNDIKIDQKGTAIVTLGPTGIQGQAVLYIDGVRKKIVYLYNGETSVALNNFAQGKYNVTIEFLGNSYYDVSTASTTFEVTKYETSISINVTDIKVGENQTISIVTVPDFTGEAILSINGVNSTIFLDKGITNITVSNLGSGSYDVIVFYNENSKYLASNASASFRVLKTLTNLTVDIKEDGLNAKVTVKTNYTECTGTVGVYVNFKHYTLDLTNGMATFDVVLDNGTNYIFVYYEGDSVYEGSTWNTTLGVDNEFVFVGENSTGFEHNDFNYAIRLIEPNGIPMPQRVVTVSFDNQNYTVKTNDEGIAYFKLNLQAGSYEISASYKNKTISNTLTVKKIDFNVTAHDTQYGLNETIKVDFDKNLTGKANIYIENELDVTVDIVNGSVSYNVSSLKVGDYEVVVKYVNDHFTSDAKSAEFKVDKATPEMSSDVEDMIYCVDGSIIVKLPNDATGNVVFVIDDVETTKEITDGESQISLSNMDKGTHSVIIKYMGDSNYNNVSLISSFAVKDKYSGIELLVNDSTYGEEIKVIAILDEDATGSVEFTISDITKSVEVKNGVATCTFSGFDADEYIIGAKYLGDHNYISSKNSTSFKVSKANSTIDVYVKEIYLNENIRIYANLSSNATGSVSFSMIGYYSPRDKAISNSVASWYISPLSTGNYTVVAIYSGDKNYYSSNTTYTLQVAQHKSVLTVSIDDAGINDRVIANIKLTSSDGASLTGLINLTVGTTFYSVNVNKGKATLILGKLTPGNYTFSAVYGGSDEYAKSTSKGSFKVVNDLLNLKLVAKNVTCFYGSDKKLVISAVNDNNNPISGVAVVVKLNGVTYTLITDEDGEVAIPIKLNVGSYVANVIFEETSKYHSASATASVNVLTTVEAMDVVKIYGSGTQYFAIFTDSNGKALANKEIKLTVGSNSYSVSTLPNGIARVNINFSPGKYQIVAKNPATGQSVTNSIFVFLKLMENKNVVKYFGGSQSYKVRAYDNNGKPVGAGKIVTIKVNGKTYKIKTNKNGYAICKINLKPKTYTITATYDGYKVSNKIKVKPVLTAKNLSVKKGKVIKFKAKLVSTKGKALKNKKITFKFKGKTYKVKTNKKGIATLKLKLKLKVGKHKIVVKYGKSKLTKKIRVKR